MKFYIKIYKILKFDNLKKLKILYIKLKYK